MKTTTAGMHQSDCVHRLSVLPTIPCASVTYLLSVYAFDLVGVIPISLVHMHAVDPHCYEADLLKYTCLTPAEWKKSLRARRQYTAGQLITLHACITSVQCSTSNIHLPDIGAVLSHPLHLYVIHTNLRIGTPMQVMSRRKDCGAATSRRPAVSTCALYATHNHSVSPSSTLMCSLCHSVQG